MPWSRRAASTASHGPSCSPPRRASSCTSGWGTGQLPAWRCSVREGEQRFHPREQSAGRGVANSQPDNRRPWTATTDPLGEILVLGDHHGTVLLRVAPDLRIFALSQAYPPGRVPPDDRVRRGRGDERRVGKESRRGRSLY